MRAIWKGAIAFGLVNVPVKLYAATESHDIGLHQVHDRDGGRIRYQRRCEVCGEVVDYDHIEKAYQDGDQTVVLTDEDLASLPAERSREIDVVEFVPSDQVDPIMFDRSYFLEPDSKSVKAYSLLRRTLEETDRTAIVHFALRQRTRLGALRVHGNVLMLQSLLWGDEVREAQFPALEHKAEVSARELEMSSALVDSFAGDFTPEKFEDEYQAQLQQLIEAKLEKGETLDTRETFGEEQEESEGGEVLDLMEALRRSVDKQRVGTRGGEEGAKTAGRKSPATKEPAKHAPPKKESAKKESAKKETAKKAPAEKSAAKKPAKKSA